MITEPGAYTMSLAEYLADPCPEPSLNHSLAHILLTQSPWHARLAHPRLAGTPPPPNHSAPFDLGAAVHQLALEGESAFLEVHAPDWRTTAAKAHRKVAYDSGLIPLLSHQIAAVREMAAAIAAQCVAHPDPVPLMDGTPEVVLIWREGPLWCRARLDYLHDDHRTIDDLKTTSESAHPAKWSRGLWERGHDLQVAFHTRGVEAVFGVRPEFRFVVVETASPFALSVLDFDPEALAFADTRRRRALARWAQCLRTGRWPGYAHRTVSTGVPPWIVTREQEAVFYEEGLE